MAVLYKKYVQDMYSSHIKEFAEFKRVHDVFMQDRKKYRAEFDRLGLPLLELAQDYERKLCGGMERGLHGKFSATVAEKFWAEIKKTYPYIQLVGVESSLG